MAFYQPMGSCLKMGTPRRCVRPCGDPRLGSVHRRVEANVAMDACASLPRASPDGWLQLGFG